jgi:hypothetical protein
MVTLRWSEDGGWHDGRLGPHELLSLAPSAAVFHYGQEIFEGMTAYRHRDGTAALFRPRTNAARFNASARRLAMPELPADTFLRTVELLVDRYLFCVIASPAPATFSTTSQPPRSPSGCPRSTRGQHPAARDSPRPAETTRLPSSHSERQSSRAAIRSYGRLPDDAGWVHKVGDVDPTIEGSTQ